MENGEASSSGTNVRSTLAGMGFADHLIEKAIMQHGEQDVDLLVETILAYPDGDDMELKPDPVTIPFLRSSGAVLISNSESSDSLEHLFGDEDVSSRSVPTSNPLKEDPDDECCGDKKASLLMMKFTREEVEFAIRELGEDAPVNELVDLIIAAQTGSTDDLNQTLPSSHEEATTTSQTLIERLVDMGFTEQEISMAIEKYGLEVSIEELANAIVCAQMGVPYVKTKEDSSTSFGENLGRRKKFKSTSMGATEVLDAGSSRTATKRPISLKVSQSRLKHKERRVAAMAVQKLIQPSCSSVDRMLAKSPFFFYGNVTNLSPDSWVKISQHLYAIKPEFVNTQSFSPLNRKEGYIHNLPTKNRFDVLPKPSITIKEAIPHMKMYWPTMPESPESSERMLGYPMNHTMIEGLTRGERFHLLKYSFETNTLGYHLSVLRSLFPNGINVLSIYSGVGGVEITLNRLGIRLKTVVSIEPSEPGRKILKRWWEESGQRGELVQIENIQQLSTKKLESLMEDFGVFDIIFCQGPYTHHATNVTMSTATQAESYAPWDMLMFYHFVRVLGIVRRAIKTE